MVGDAISVAADGLMELYELAVRFSTTPRESITTLKQVLDFFKKSE
jgi:hypothetical protein